MDPGRIVIVVVRVIIVGTCRPRTGPAVVVRVLVARIVGTRVEVSIARAGVVVEVTRAAIVIVEVRVERGYPRRGRVGVPVVGVSPGVVSGVVGRIIVALVAILAVRRGVALAECRHELAGNVDDLGGVEFLDVVDMGGILR